MVGLRIRVAAYFVMGCSAACALCLIPGPAQAQGIPTQTVPVTTAPKSSETKATPAKTPNAPPAAKSGKKPPRLEAKSAAKAAAIASANAVLFEGYSKVLLGGVHIGFTVSRYEFDAAKKEFVSTYFLKTGALGNHVTESLKARATSGFRPVSYQYTTIVGGKTKTIDASFRGDNMTAVVNEDGKSTTVRKTIPKTAFPSTFLVYMMLNSKDGIKPGLRYAFVAIAEEDAAVYPGEAQIVSPEAQNGIAAFKVFMTFKGVRFASFVTQKGDVLATRSTIQGLATELVPTLQEATAGQSFNPSMLVTLFGQIPEGKQNALVRQEAMIKTTPTITPPAATADTSPAPTQASTPDAAPAETSAEAPAKVEKSATPEKQ
ncbi:MAG: hypothetical protein NDI61_00150 [Bdellovibrionaceae bacterium]|nr:hypothetical protein [Pseudobdellovibrionaceae bacterium]